MFVFLFRTFKSKIHNFTLCTEYAMYVRFKKQIQTTAYSLNNGVADVSFSRRTNKAKNY